MNHQYVDPEVTKVKFESELKEFKDQLLDYRKRGIIFLGSNNYSIDLLFAVANMMPQFVGFGVRIDYSNWDIEPPSVSFINPFTSDLVRGEELLLKFMKKQPNGSLLNLAQGVGDLKPFFCIPGTKEYHVHWAHSGDSWFLHKGNGEGKLCTLIEQLYVHSIYQVDGLRFGVQMVVSQSFDR